MHFANFAANLSRTWVPSSPICLYTLGIDLSSVNSAVKHSSYDIIWKITAVCIRGSDHSNVQYVARHSVDPLFWRHMRKLTTRNTPASSYPPPIVLMMTERGDRLISAASLCLVTCPPPLVNLLRCIYPAPLPPPDSSVNTIPCC